MDNDNTLDANELFISQAYIPNLGPSYKRFLNNNGILKEFKIGILANRIVNKNQVYYRLRDLPNYLQENLLDKAMSANDIRNLSNKANKKQEFVDKEGVKIYITATTEILPVVGNLLPQDGVYAYTVVEKDNQIMLKPILTSPHWADVFAGKAEFGMNVFCLASDLTLEQQEYFKNSIIELKDALDFLEQNKSPRL